MSSNPLPRHAWWLVLRAGLSGERPPGAALPQDVAHWHAPALNPSTVAAFHRHLGYGPETPVPLCLHYLSLQRAQLEWMLRPAFPHRVVGMVHMAQSITALAPWTLEAPFEVLLSARSEGKRNVRLNAELLQHGVPVVRAWSLYRPPREPGARPLRDRAPEPAPDTELQACWDLPANAGVAYAWMSGDANPIHLWPWTARRLGMAQPIIHGMHTMARCEAEWARAGGQALQHLELQFLRPLALPGWAALYGEPAAFEVFGPAGRCASGSAG
ncbi:MAG: MaoC/PaaZ C-terminal domain-containing protein [Inhella sp.]|uniref:MaoC/PaaZ C-terminal domain-containing protein n=1 Tax=Inhella sp. TaxID=1921806 RepID=UPI0022C3AF61|nr:MaoC/PaaZ C-terminal domain-containing protein [Inhella sp.]MCZ8234563.1 MaoC/PaaZ C-terminal domain-containing protein [Inhella sp.]